MDKEKYWELKTQGLCVYCGNVKVTGGRACCEPCRVKHRQYDKNRYYRRKHKDTCVKCGNELSGVSDIFCDKHYRYNIISSKAWRDRHKFVSKCTACGEDMPEFASLVGRKTCGCVVQRRRQRNESIIARTEV